jgi:hypothetical protein
MKKNINNLIILLISLYLFSCETKKDGTNNEERDKITFIQKEILNVSDINSTTEIDTVLNIISELNEVANLKKRHDINGNKSIIIVETPNVNFDYFWVQVGNSNKERFEPLYNFYVTPKNYFMYFLDTLNDTIISIEDWRKTRNW